MPRLVYKYSFPRSFTCQTVASAFTVVELHAGLLDMSWRMSFSEDDLELSPKKPLWFFPGDKFMLTANKVLRIV
jgi:hypothetical protein